MNALPRTLSTTHPNWLDAAASTIHAGRIVALAYERLFGLAVNALDAEAVNNVARIKDRNGDSSKPIAVVLPDIQALSHFCDGMGRDAFQLATRHWPGPLTLIVRAKPNLPKPLVSQTGLIGLRVAGTSPAAQLAKKTGLPLTATSANAAGAPYALSHHDLMKLDSIDLIIEGEVPGPPGSTVVDASGDSPVVLRQGIIPI